MSQALVYKEGDALLIEDNPRLVEFLQKICGTNGFIPSSAYAVLRDAGWKLLVLAQLVKYHGPVHVQKVD